MKVSTNQFTKFNFNRSTGSWTNQIKVSSNAFVKRTVKRGMDKWSGANTSEGAFGVQDEFGGLDSTFGTDVYESTAHFKLRTEYSISR